MTRKEEIEKIARDYENKIIENNPGAESYDYMNAVIYGAEWADKTNWKPSKKQLDALNDILDVLKNTERFNSYLFYVLEELKNELKAL